MKKIFLYVLSCISMPLFAQKADTLFHLNEVEVNGIRERYTFGSKIIKTDSLQLLQHGSGSVADYLSNAANLHFKKYGSGMLSTISFRGTTASHTAVLWNGMNINSFTLGQTDFSALPVSAFTSIDLQYGTASSLYGSDAIGGTVYLSSDPVRKEGIGVASQLSTGSLGSLFSAFKVSSGRKKVFMTTGFYNQYGKNNFTFQDITKPGAPIARQENAAYYQFGLTNDISIILSPNRLLNFHAWAHFQDRELQPRMGDLATDQMQDNAFRVSGVFSNKFKNKGVLQVRVGYTLDKNIYNKFSIVKVNRFFGAVEYDKSWNRFSFKSGLSSNFLAAESDGFGELINEIRTDLFTSLSSELFKNAFFSINLRQPVIDQALGPLTPSLGTEFFLVSTDNLKSSMKSSFSYGYRIPTFNDRFWQPGGNPDLIPEKSKNGEAGFTLAVSKSNFKSSTEATFFRNRVNNMIIWLPGNFWYSKNIKTVDIYGTEFNINAITKVQGLKIETQSKYSYTVSLNKTALDRFDRSVGKQLPYTPRHRLFSGINFTYRTISLGCNNIFTGKRFITADNATSLDPYLLTDLILSFSKKIATGALHSGIRIENILNTTYTEMPLRAMPGRVYNVFLNFNIHNQ